MRPYKWDSKVKAYAVKDARGGNVYRRTRTAAGMTASNARSGRSPKKDEVLSLCVRGTAGGMPGNSFNAKTVSRGTCQCCGQTVRKLALSDSGRLRLRHLQRAKARRVGPVNP